MAINLAIREIGMGWYQRILFVLAGIGWFVDNFILQAISLLLPELAPAFVLGDAKIRFVTVAFSVGLALGAFSLSYLADKIGRKAPYAVSLAIGASFGIAASQVHDFALFSSLIGCAGFGIGGSLPCDAMMFMEFLPSNKSSWTVGLTECNAADK